MKMNEEATFAVYQKKLKGICEENDLQATFNRSGYPLTMTVRPLQDVADQMSMLEKVEDNCSRLIARSSKRASSAAPRWPTLLCWTSWTPRRPRTRF